MEISKLIRKAEKRLNITKFVSKGLFKQQEFVTIVRYPIEARSEIKNARNQGLDIVYFEKYIIEHDMVEQARNGTLDYIDLMKKDPEFQKNYVKPDFDVTRMDLKMKMLEYGLDIKNHSFKDNGIVIGLSSDIFKLIHDQNKALFDFLITEIGKFNDGLELGEQTGTK